MPVSKVPFPMVDQATLDRIVRQTATIDSADGITGERDRPAQDVLRQWLANPDALSRVMPLILVRYRVAVRPAEPPERTRPQADSSGADRPRRRMFSGPRIA